MKPPSEAVIAKVNEVVGLANVRWVVCSNADPDVVGGLGRLEECGLHPEATLVTHWHDQMLLAHTGTRLPFWRIEDHGWRLALGDRELRFEAIPYAPAAGAFATFDESTGVLFSSNLFGGQSPDGQLVANSLDYYDAIRPFHQHFIPGRDVLAHVLARLRQLPATLLAPHHGQLVPEGLIAPLSERLERLQCGLVTLADTDPRVRFLLGANQTIHRVIDALVHEQQFSDVVAILESLAQRSTGATTLELWAGTRDAMLHFEASDGFVGRRDEPPEDVVAVLRGVATPRGARLILPIVTSEASQIEGAVVLVYDAPVAVDDEVLAVVQEIIGLIGVGLEREVLRRSTDIELAIWRRRAVLDALTGLHNRASLADSARRMAAFDEQLRVAQMAAAMVDIDHFKAINDTYGHLTGDRVLQHVAHAITESVRPSDLIFRYGGEEFLILLAHVDPATARQAAERIRARIAVPLESFSISVSVGVANRVAGEGHESLIERADQALYLAKSRGRDRVEVL
ncbi:MAG: diguanylate cyclase [Actinomycetales bacterium]|nr:diguanylate cyclase [Actinomycetales bacterium]